MTRDALFGGSFDPVHVAHMMVAEAAADELGATIRFLPAREQPFKRAAHQASAEQRAAMLDLAVHGNSRLRVERIELDLPTPSYTVRTLRALAAPFPGTRFVPTGGIDASRMAAYLADPAVLAVGGSWLATPAHLERGDYDEIRRLTADAMERSMS